MRSFLCAEFLDFVAQRFPAAAGDGGPCLPATCLGPGHVRACADAVAPGCGVPGPALLQSFGTALFGRLVRGYPAFFVGMRSTIDLVSRYETHVAAEVAKLAPAFPLPSLALVRRKGRPVEVLYRSPDGLADLAEGLLAGSVAHFEERLRVTRGRADASGCSARFVLGRRVRTGA